MNCSKLLFLVTTFAITCPTSTSQRLPTLPVPQQVWNRRADKAFSKGFQRGFVTTLTPHKAVRIYWTATAAILDPSPRPIPNKPVTQGTQSIGIRFYPTEAAVLNPNAILVAGIKVTGETVIEKWGFFVAPSYAWPNDG